jgi:uncharacterized membrane protein
MNRNLAASLGLAAFAAAIVLLTGEVAAVSIMRYFTSWQTPPDVILANRFAHPFLFLHVAGGVTALVIAPLQFVKRIRDKAPTFHRAIGRTYAIACAVAAPAGFMLAMGTTAGPMAAAGFAIPAILWPLFTYLGVKAAMGSDFDEHRQWMIRSYAITANAIMLRLMLPFAGLVLGIPFLPAYRAISWLSWITTLALAELYLRREVRSITNSAEVAIA